MHTPHGSRVVVGKQVDDTAFIVLLRRRPEHVTPQRHTGRGLPYQAHASREVPLAPTLNHVRPLGVPALRVGTVDGKDTEVPARGIGPPIAVFVIHHSVVRSLQPGIAQQGSHVHPRLCVRKVSHPGILQGREGRIEFFGGLRLAESVQGGGQGRVVHMVRLHEILVAGVSRMVFRIVRLRQPGLAQSLLQGHRRVRVVVRAVLQSGKRLVDGIRHRTFRHVRRLPAQIFQVLGQVFRTQIFQGEVVHGEPVRAAGRIAPVLVHHVPCAEGHRPVLAHVEIQRVTLGRAVLRGHGDIRPAGVQIQVLHEILAGRPRQALLRGQDGGLHPVLARLQPGKGLRDVEVLQSPAVHAVLAGRTLVTDISPRQPGHARVLVLESLRVRVPFRHVGAFGIRQGTRQFVLIERNVEHLLHHHAGLVSQPEHQLVALLVVQPVIIGAARSHFLAVQIPFLALDVVPIGKCRSNAQRTSHGHFNLRRVATGKALAVVSRRGRKRAVHTLAAHRDGEHLRAFHALGVGVRHAVDARMVGRDLALAARRAVFPLPLARVRLAFRQLHGQRQHRTRLHLADFRVVPRLRRAGYLREQDGRHLVRRHLAPVVVHQRAETRMVVAAAVAAVRAAAQLHADGVLHLVAVFHRDAHAVLVVVDEQLPDGAGLSASRAVQPRHPPVLRIRQVVDARVVGRHVFRRARHHGRAGLARDQTIVQVAERVVALVVGILERIRQQAQRGHRVSLVAPALLHLVQVAQRAAAVLVEPGNQSPAVTAHAARVLVGMLARDAQRLVARAFLDPPHAIIIDVRRVAQDTHGHAEHGVAQSPVAVVVIPVALTGHRVVPTLQEVLCRSEPHVYQVLLEQVELLLAPSVAPVVAHQLRRVGELVAREARNQGHVGVAPQILVPSAPGVQGLHRPVGIGGLPRDFPHQRALVSVSRATVGIHVVLRTRSPDDGLRHAHVSRVDDTPRVAQAVQRRHHVRIPGRHTVADGLEVSLRMEQARMAESALGHGTGGQCHAEQPY